MHAERGGTPSKFTFLWIVVLLLSLVFILNFLDRVSKLVAVQSEIASVQSGMQRAEQWNLQLKEDLKHYASSGYVEEMARSELGYVQPGDNVLVVLESEAAAGDGALVQPQPADHLPAEDAPVFFSVDWWKTQFQAWGVVR